MARWMFLPLLLCFAVVVLSSKETSQLEREEDLVVLPPPFPNLRAEIKKHPKCYFVLTDLNPNVGSNSLKNHVSLKFAVNKHPVAFKALGKYVYAADFFVKKGMHQYGRWKPRYKKYTINLYDGTASNTMGKLLGSQQVSVNDTNTFLQFDVTKASAHWVFMVKPNYGLVVTVSEPNGGPLVNPEYFGLGKVPASKAGQDYIYYALYKKIQGCI